MFGSYEVPFNIVQELVSLSVTKEGENLRYTRESPGEKVEKILLSNNPRILINPIEPLNKPKELTPYLFVEFGKTLAIEPKVSKTVFVKFPIEIGIFLSGAEDSQVLDIFTLMPQKFTLYGDPRTGFICKHSKSEVYSSAPGIDRIHEGLIELTITNATTSWTEVTKAVFSAYGMKIYYSEKLVSLKANMKVKGAQIAETDFDDSHLETGMKKSLELYATRKLSISTTKFVMELGI